MAGVARRRDAVTRLMDLQEQVRRLRTRRPNEQTSSDWIYLTPTPPWANLDGQGLRGMSWLGRVWFEGVVVGGADEDGSAPLFDADNPLPAALRPVVQCCVIIKPNPAAFDDRDLDDTKPDVMFVESWAYPDGRWEVGGTDYAEMTPTGEFPMTDITWRAF